MDMSLILVFVCLTLSFFFSASETALSSLGKLEVQSIMARGGWRSKVIQSWVRDPGRVLITILVANNIVNHLASFVFALWASRRFTSWSTTVALGAFTFVFIIGSEIVPKLLARNSALQSAPFAMRFLQFAGILIFPVTYVAHKVSSGIVFLSGRVGREHRTVISEEELTHTIEIATKEGGIDRETGEVLSNLMDFPDLLARDIMTPRLKIQALSIGSSLEEAMRFIAADGHSRYPVVRSSLDELVGVVLVKDFLAHLQKGAQGSWTRVVRRPYFVSEMAALGTILRDMKRWGTHLALVRNETGVLTGLLTLEDLIEEIVGEIRDEHDDPAEGGGERAMGGPWLVSGEIPILDFNDKYNASLPMDVTYSTLNGYLLSKTGGQLPPVGTLIFGDDVTFRVHSIADNGITTVQIIAHANASAQRGPDS